MKKVIALSAALVLLAMGGLGGFAYAQGHEVVAGQKLIGWGALGAQGSGSEGVALYSRFVITNPDCVNQVTDIEIRVIRDDGTVYTGVLIQPIDSSVITELSPHRSGVVDLFMTVFPGQTALDPREWGHSPYTVEVSWKGNKNGLPLIGWSVLMTATFDWATGNLLEDMTTCSESQMINMGQNLK